MRVSEENLPQGGIFGAFEGPYQARFRRWRDRWLSPFLALLGQAGVEEAVESMYGIGGGHGEDGDGGDEAMHG